MVLILVYLLLQNRLTLWNFFSFCLSAWWGLHVKVFASWVLKLLTFMCGAQVYTSVCKCPWQQKMRESCENDCLLYDMLMLTTCFLSSLKPFSQGISITWGPRVVYKISPTSEFPRVLVDFFFCVGEFLLGEFFFFFLVIIFIIFFNNFYFLVILVKFIN